MKIIFITEVLQGSHSLEDGQERLFQDTIHLARTREPGQCRHFLQILTGGRQSKACLFYLIPLL
jgi:hypothetical protein